MSGRLTRLLAAGGRGLGRCMIGAIRFYQAAVSPWKGASCRFQPTCSQYMIEAVERRGPIVGFLLGLWRILRCNPFCRGGYDPVDVVDRVTPSAHTDSHDTRPKTKAPAASDTSEGADTTDA